MARYYIDTDDGALRVIDEEGYEVADANVARDLALAALPAMVSDCIRADIGRKRFQVEVRSETGAAISWPVSS